VGKVALYVTGGVTHPAEPVGRQRAVARNPGLGPGRGAKPELDLILDDVRQLQAAEREQLDSVVRRRIVTGGQHHAKFGAELAVR